MKLINIEFVATQLDGSTDWELNDLILDDFNLLVGKNATGKSLTLKVIEEFTKIIANSGLSIWYGGQKKRNYQISLMNEVKDIIDYTCHVERGQGLNKMITKEILSVNGKEKLIRNQEECLIYSETLQKFVEIDPPVEEIVLHSRRDRKEYPYLEQLLNWAKNTIAYNFISIKPFYKEEIRERNIHPTIIINAYQDDTIFINQLLKDINSIGFNINNIIGKEVQENMTFFIQEEGIKKEINEGNLSDGMFRAISLITYISYLLKENRAATILIDDLSEGLDFNRATKLAQLLLQKIEGSAVQLIATTNDSFLMDAISTQHWNILKREGNTVKSYNYKNCKDIFDDFDFTGLSNFDLFSSDYLDKKLWKQVK